MAAIVQVSVAIPVPLHDRLQAAARDADASKGEIIRRALERFLPPSEGEIDPAEKPVGR